MSTTTTTAIVLSPEDDAAQAQLAVLIQEAIELRAYHLAKHLRHKRNAIFAKYNVV